MPQFDSYSFSGQTFWSLLGFFVFYFFVLNSYLIRFSELFKMRQKLISLFLKENKALSSFNSSFDLFVSLKKFNLL